MQRLLIALLACSPLFGAASIVISSATVPAAGRIVSVPIGGCAGALSPASGITGFTVTDNLGGTANSLLIASVTSAGTCGVDSTVTITLGPKVAAGTTVNVALATSATSNLTDTGSNTPTGNNVNATNSATATGTFEAAYPDATCVAGGGGASHAVLGGRWGAGSGYLGQNYCGIFGNNSSNSFTVTGTDADTLMPPGFTCNWSVDGGAPQSASATGTTWPRISLFSGLSAAAHTVELLPNCWASTSSPFIFVQSSGTPSIAVTSGMGQNIYPIVTTPSRFVRNGMGVQTSLNGYDTIYTDRFYSDFGFRTDAADIWLWTFRGQAVPLNVLQDGVSISTYTTLNTSTYGWQHVATGLSGTHDYRFQFSSTTNAGQFLQVYSVMLGGGTLSATTQTTLSTILQYGDSITQQIGVADPRTGDMWKLSKALNVSVWGDGNSGEKVSTYLQTHASETCINPQKIVQFQGGTNDTGNATARATFITSYTTMLQNADACAQAGTIFLARGLLPKSSDPAPGVALYSLDIQTAVDAYMAGAHTTPAYYVPIDTWGFNTATDTDDGIHPNAVGTSKLASFQVRVYQKYLYGCGSTTGMQPKCNGVQ